MDESSSLKSEALSEQDYDKDEFHEEQLIENEEEESIIDNYEEYYVSPGKK